MWTRREDRYGSLSTLQLVFTAVWLFLAFSGWVLLMGGLSGFQKDINKHKNTDLWAIPANYPYLTPHHILRYKTKTHSCLIGRLHMSKNVVKQD